MNHFQSPVIKFPVLNYDFSKLDNSGNYIIRKTCCIVFDLKRNIGQMHGLNEVIQHGTKSVKCRLGPHHFNKYHAYEYFQMNKSMNKVLADL